MKRATTFISIFFTVLGSAQLPELSWGLHIGHSETVQTQNSLIRCDRYGNAYAVGHFEGEIDADPSTDNLLFNSLGANDLYIAKYSLTRELQWAIQLSGPGNLHCMDIEVEPEGDFVIAGSFNGNVDFDAGPGAFNLWSAGTYYDAFVAKYNATGELLWAFSIGTFTSSAAYVDKVDIDVNGVVCITGQVHGGPVDMDPAPVSSSLLTGNSTAFYLAKYNPDGTHILSFGYSGPSSIYSRGEGVEVTSDGSMIVLGQLQGTANIDPHGLGTMLTTNHYFLAKYSRNGELMWMNELPFPAVTLITDDERGTIIIEGSVGDSVDIDPGAGVYYLSGPPGLVDICCVTYYAMDGAFASAFSFGSCDDYDVPEVALDAAGNIYMIGDFQDSIDIDPASGTHMLVNPSRNVFVSSYTPEGELRWGFDLGAPSRDELGFAIDVYADYFFITGTFSPVIDLDPGPEAANQNSPGLGSDTFFAKYIDPLHTQTATGESISMLPNPTNGQISVQGMAGKAYSVVVYDMLGNKVLESGPFEYQLWLDMRGLADGVYAVDVYSGTDRVETSKVILTK
jgi:hypothetical protein